MFFDIKSDYSTLLFPARIAFGTSWPHELRISLERISDKKSSLGVMFVHTPSQKNAVLDLMGGLAIHNECFSEARTRCNEESVFDIDILCARRNIKVLVAVGGGSVIDLCKLVASRRNITLIVIPSTLSSDCIASPISVVTRIDGTRQSVPAAMPNEIIIDTAVLAAAPVRLLKAGIGDLLSNISALTELQESQGNKSELNGFGLLLSEASVARFLSEFAEFKDDLSNLCLELSKGLVLSGMAMGFAGDSSPCSGSEHLISHSLDLCAENRAMHGEQVGLATVFVDEVRRYLGKKVFPRPIIEILKEFCGFHSPEKFGISKAEFLKAIASAESIRPGRTPIWSSGNLTPDDFSRLYDIAFR